MKEKTIVVNDSSEAIAYIMKRVFEANVEDTENMKKRLIDSMKEVWNEGTEYMERLDYDKISNTCSNLILFCGAAKTLDLKIKKDKEFADNLEVVGVEHDELN
jgi:hypothetical protein